MPVPQQKSTIIHKYNNIHILTHISHIRESWGCLFFPFLHFYQKNPRVIRPAELTPPFRLNTFSHRRCEKCQRLQIHLRWILLLYIPPYVSIHNIFICQMISDIIWYHSQCIQISYQTLSNSKFFLGGFVYSIAFGHIFTSMEKSWGMEGGARGASAKLGPSVLSDVFHVFEGPRVVVGIHLFVPTKSTAVNPAPPKRYTTTVYDMNIFLRTSSCGKSLGRPCCLQPFHFNGEEPRSGRSLRPNFFNVNLWRLCFFSVTSVRWGKMRKLQCCVI